MADLTLSDGRQLDGDMSKITVLEYRKVVTGNRDSVTQEEEDGLIGRVFGLSGDDVANLPYPDYRLLCVTFFKIAREPIDEGDKKNSGSVSTLV